MATTGEYAQIVQVLKQFFVFFDRENYCLGPAILDQRTPPRIRALSS
jgi:hypothetical protein